MDVVSPCINNSVSKVCALCYKKVCVLLIICKCLCSIMFFDRNNCRTYRLLNNISYILEASIKRLVELERETLRAIENEKANKHSNGEQSSATAVKVKTEPPDEVASNSNAPELFDPNTTTCRIRLVPASKLRQEKRLRQPNPELNTENTASCIKRKPESTDLESSLTGETSSKLMKILKEPVDPKDTVVKKELDISELGKDSGEMFSPETSSSVLNQLNKSSNNKGVPPESSNANVKKEISDELPQFEDPFLVAQVPRNRIKYGNDLHQALIKFKQRVSYNAAKEVLVSAGVHNIDDLAITEKEAVVTFFNVEDWQVLMALSSRSGLKTIKATSIKPYNNCSSQ